MADARSRRSETLVTLAPFGGPDGELAAAMRYFTQGLGKSDPGRQDLLIDIATEELSHLEVIGSIVAMLNKGAKAQLSEAAMEEADLYMAINSSGNSHTQSLLYGGGPSLTNSSVCRGPQPRLTRRVTQPVTFVRILPPKAERRSSMND